MVGSRGQGWQNAYPISPEAWAGEWIWLDTAGPLHSFLQSSCQSAAVVVSRLIRFVPLSGLQV